MKKFNHLVSVQQVSDRAFLDKLFALAADFQEHNTRNNALEGKILASLFFEPSTRTRFSFESAMLRLGGQVITSENASDYSSAKKGETLEDTVRTVAGYADCIVLRHPEKGAAQRAAQVSPVPIINAGDGSGEHPTQALLDMYTIQKEKGNMDGLTITIVGDLLYGRTVHSLVQLLALYRDIHIALVSPAQLRLPEEYKQNLRAQKISFKETEDFPGALQKADVVYMTRLQKERFSSQPDLLTLNVNKSSYILDEAALSQLSQNAIILHPLPRVDEISPIVDSDPRAAYFRQAQNGLYVRMALLQSVLDSA